MQDADEVGGWTKTRPVSLGLLPSGPDPVGEWNVHRQPPSPYLDQVRGFRNGRVDAVQGGPALSLTLIFSYIQKFAGLSSDPFKRLITLKEPELDFEDAKAISAGDIFDVPDDRRDYGEVRIVTTGFLDGRMVMVGWTPRGEKRHIFSMRTCNARERRKFTPRFAALEKQSEGSLG